MLNKYLLIKIGAQKWWHTEYLKETIKVSKRIIDCYPTIVCGNLVMEKRCLVKNSIRQSMKPTVPTNLITCSDLQAVLSPYICHACTTKFSRPKCLDQQFLSKGG